MLANADVMLMTAKASGNGKLLFRVSWVSALRCIVTALSCNAQTVSNAQWVMYGVNMDSQHDSTCDDDCKHAIPAVIVYEDEEWITGGSQNIVEVVRHDERD